MKKTAAKDWFSFFAPRFLCLTLALGFIIRIILILHPMTVVDWGLADWLKIFFLGVINDVAFTAIALVPAFLIYTTFTDDKYGRRAGWIIWSLLMALTLYLVLCNDITDEYLSYIADIDGSRVVYDLGYDIGKAVYKSVNFRFSEISAKGTPFFHGVPSDLSGNVSTDRKAKTGSSSGSSRFCCDRTKKGGSPPPLFALPLRVKRSPRAQTRRKAFSFTRSPRTSA